ncbi:hypothetical protein BS47DRAFT_1396967 [Hydnum rufescens UP504]|uniref:Anaphase-promoting complex subunit 4 n=1 Tax=Hydnum rufescens UP504 TaxID=1448309 RepID=A0A9P6DSB1_9AGAM|nr:hypothetical protein BS47DRAFT_1396967 [Hydnum rufescens UP504]
MPVNRSLLDDPSQFSVYSWCPKLDVFVLVTRIAERNHLVLRSLREQAVWDRELEAETPHPEITNVCWSPDALVIVVAHGGLKLTFHSLHDGRVLKTLPLNLPDVDGVERRLVSDLWWRKHEIKERPEAFQDPGSAHSVLRLLPLLDTVPPDAARLVPSIRLAKWLISIVSTFQSTRSTALWIPKTTRESTIKAAPSDKDPALIPALASDVYGASIAPPMTHADLLAAQEGKKHPSRDEPAQTQTLKDNQRSLLIVGDTSGYLHFFLDGFYPLGHQYLGDVCCPVAVYAPPLPPYNPSTDIVTNGSAASLRFPLLHLPWTRAMARTSSSVKELLVYITSVVNEMRDGWIGTETREGAHSMGAKWLKHLEEMQAAHGDGVNGDALLDLTTLLLTGRSPHSLREFFSSGGRLSERAMSQWEATMTRALAVLQEYSERKLVPACERLVILLEEVQGWSDGRTQRYKAFHLREADIIQVIKQTTKVIEFAEWLARDAEEEMLRYLEFVKWFRSESLRVNDGSANELRPIAFDPLEVLDYLENGFTHSHLDRWFTGPMPLIAPSALITEPFESVAAVLATARSFLNKKSTRASSGDVHMSEGDISVSEEDLDDAEAEREHSLENMSERNLVLLVEDIVQRCLGIFIPASGAVVRRVEAKTTPLHPRTSSGHPPPMREGERHGTMAKSLSTLFYDMSKMGSKISIRVRPFYPFRDWNLDGPPAKVGAHVAECVIDDVLFELLDMDYYDDTSVVMILRNHGVAYLMQIEYAPRYMAYAEVAPDISPLSHREGWALRIREAVNRGQFPKHFIPQGRARKLDVCSEGGGWVAVNGDRRRQVAVVLDERGKGQVFDLMPSDGGENNILGA